METKTVSILSIEAWGNKREGYQWNSWYKRGSIEVDLIPSTNRGILKLMRSMGHLSAFSAGKVAVEDDGYNIVIVDRSSMEPLFAIAYGEALR